MLKDIFTPELIQHYKINKSEITSELLESLRQHGNEGKQLALELLDLEKDSESYYLDAFGNRISNNGNRRIKKAFTKLPLSEIHIEEIIKCSEDVHYFKDNYIRIRTKSGVNFPEMRQYQNDFISELIPDENESIIGLMGRQSGKSISTGIYLTHLLTFDKEKNIGIVANKGGMAREFLANVKNMVLELPIWMQCGFNAWNKSFIEAENGMRILTDVPSGDSFRGYSVHCLSGDSEVEVYDTLTKTYKTITLETLYEKLYMKLNDRYLIKTQSGYKSFRGLRRTENTGLIITLCNGETIKCTKNHQVLTGTCNAGKIYRRSCNLKIGDKVGKYKVSHIDINSDAMYYYDPVEVLDCNNYISAGITHHNCLVIDEAAFIKTNRWNEFSDAIFPSQSGLAWKKNVIISTANGMNEFFKLVKGARDFKIIQDVITVESNYKIGGKSISELYDLYK